MGERDTSHRVNVVPDHRVGGILGYLGYLEEIKKNIPLISEKDTCADRDSNPSLGVGNA